MNDRPDDWLPFLRAIDDAGGDIGRLMLALGVFADYLGEHGDGEAEACLRWCVDESKSPSQSMSRRRFDWWPGGWRGAHENWGDHSWWPDGWRGAHENWGDHSCLPDSLVMNSDGFFRLEQCGTYGSLSDAYIDLIRVWRLGSVNVEQENEVTA